MSKKTVVHLVTATEAKNRFGEIIRRAYANQEHLIVERGGIPVVAIVPMQDYERLVAGLGLPEELAQGVGQSSREAASRARLRVFLAEAHAEMPDVPEDEVDRDVQKAVETVRRQK